MFRPATKQDAFLRMAIMGPSGSGKTYTALAIATGIAAGDPIAVIDTESGSASKYADIFKFDVAELRDDFHPKKYMDAIHVAEKAGYRVMIIDSLSHAWFGEGGALALVDMASKRSKSGNSYAAWRDITPLQNRLVQTILNTRMHIICTLRSKTEYVIEQNQYGKSAPRKVGLAPVQRDGLDYEFDVVLEMDRDHNAIVDKTRCTAITDKTYSMVAPDSALVTELCAWLGTSPDPAQYVAPAPQEFPPSQPAPPQTQPAPPAPSKPLSDKEVLIQQAWAIAQAWNADPSDWKAAFLGKGFESSKSAPIDYVKNLNASLDAKSGLLQVLEDHIGTPKVLLFLAERGGIMGVNIEDIRAALTDEEGGTQ